VRSRPPDFTFAAGRDAGKKLFKKSRPDAVVCANDLLAVGVMHELAAYGLDVPNDVAVIRDGRQRARRAVLSRR
jgi:LacI family transcriptional regulator